jgi:hypothetical protein
MSTTSALCCAGRGSGRETQAYIRGAQRRGIINTIAYHQNGTLVSKGLYFFDFLYGHHFTKTLLQS